MGTRVFGERVERREDGRLITGRGRYLDDLGQDALAAAFVRSPHAHARIADIDVSEALDVDGPSPSTPTRTFPDGSVSRCRSSSRTRADARPHRIPAGPRRRPACRRARRDGRRPRPLPGRGRRRAIRVEYEPLPAVVGIEAATRAEHLVHDDVPGNVGAVLVQENGDAPAAIESAPHVLEFSLSIERSASMPLEGRGVYARWDADDGSLRVYSSTQASTSVRAAIAARLGLPNGKVEVVAPDVGGGFGVKIVHPWPEEILVPWAARLLDREIKWTEDRREHFVSAAHERGQLQDVRVGFDDEGRVLGLDVRIRHDHGAYTPYGIIIPIVTSTQLLGPYKIGAYRAEVTSLYTNTSSSPRTGRGPPAGRVLHGADDGPHRPPPRPRPRRRARRELHPARRVPLRPGLTFQDGRPLIYDSGDYPELLRKARELIGWEGFEAERAAAASRGRHLGIGLGIYVEGTGVGPYEGGHVEIDTAGRVHVSTGLTSQGQGHETVFAQIAAAELGVPIEDVHVTTGDTRRFGYAVGTFASRAAVMSGNAIALASRKVRAKALRIVGEAWRPTRMTWTSPTASCTCAATGRRPSRCGRSRSCRTRCGTRSTRRPPRRRSSRWAAR